MKLSRASRYISLLAVLVVLCAGFACNESSKSAAVAVNKYAETLSHFQDAEIESHNQGKIDDSTHLHMIGVRTLAVRAGRDLDSAIAVAAQGGDPSQFVDVATKTFDDLLSATRASNREDLLTLAYAAGAALKNAVSLIHQIKPQVKPTSAPANSVPGNLLSLYLAFGLLGFASVGGAASSRGLTVTGIVQWVNLITALEPVAFDLALKFATSLRGKTTEEVLAMNETLFDKIEAVDNAELEKMKNPSQS